MSLAGACHRSGPSDAGWPGGSWFAVVPFEDTANRDTDPLCDRPLWDAAASPFPSPIVSAVATVVYEPTVASPARLARTDCGALKNAQPSTRADAARKAARASVMCAAGVRP